MSSLDDDISGLFCLNVSAAATAAIIIIISIIIMHNCTKRTNHANRFIIDIHYYSTQCEMCTADVQHMVFVFDMESFRSK